MNDVFAERLKNARIMKGYSMDDLVKELGNCVTKTAIMKYEKGIMKPRIALINRIPRSEGLVSGVSPLLIKRKSETIIAPPFLKRAF